MEHSRSAAIFAAAFAATGIHGFYEARAVAHDGVRQAFAELADGHLEGLNITMPHKALAYSLCDRLDTDAARAGSVNTAVVIDHEIVGYSTDIDGIRHCWAALPPDRPVLILGSGGAAAAAAVALTEHEPYISARRFGAGAELRERTGVELGEIHWGVPVVGANVVNCTPIGMRGEQLPLAVLELAEGLFDMAYGRQTTPAVSLIREWGKPVVEGLDLLLSQAAYGFRIFTGAEPPLAAMRAAVENS
ncbi:shikimate dehydrogenase [soil metagenome]